MKNNGRDSLKYLFEFLKNAKVISHQVINPPRDHPRNNQFLSINGTITSSLIEKIIYCLIENGLRNWISFEEKIGSANLKDKVNFEKERLSREVIKFFESGSLVIKEGTEYYLPILDFEDPDIKTYRETQLISSIESLKNQIVEIIYEVWDSQRIKNEIAFRQKIKKKNELKVFIDSGDSKLLIHFFSFLLAEGLVKSNLIDLTALFSGNPPAEKVIFKDANLLNHVKIFLFENGLRKSPSYSLSSNFSPYVAFFEEKEESEIRRLLKNVSLNNTRYSKKLLNDSFQAYLEKIDH